MRAVQFVNWVILLGSASVAIVSGVVALMLAVHADLGARIGAEIGPVLQRTGLVALPAVIAPLAIDGIRRRRPWRWPLEVILLVVSVVVTLLAAPA
ncbi:hypothetical protein RM531_00610 [Salinisphaera sp. P385]|uniref:Uncharacterized protein n=1 Tax=Spectribacter acetivorans TaxID=3075603 RepID=A0ABU3B416_9GAMM|nr:hypothetical protein [Salinisphaera sp. P385]MDT0616964.1 hypothetical protein [Salinisphaera sp. P385]